MSGPIDDTHFSAPVCFGKLSSIRGRNALVVVTVQEKERSRSEATSCIHRTKTTQFASPLVEVDRESRSADCADRPAVLEEPTRLSSPVVEIRTNSQERTAFDSWVIGCDTDSKRPAGIRSDEP